MSIKIKIWFIVFTSYFLLLTAYCYAQENNHVFVERGSTTYMEWKAAGDYSAYDSLYFVVKPCTSNTCARLIQKPTTISYSEPYTTMTCTLFVDETASFNAARYYYSIYAYGPDTVWVTSGNFNLMLNGQTPTDGVPTTSPYYTIALSPPVHDPAYIIGDSSADSWSQIDTDSMRVLLGVDTVTSATSLPDSIIYTSELVPLETDVDSLYDKTNWMISAESFGVISDGTTDISTELQAAFDYANTISQTYPALYFSYDFVKAQGATVILPAGVFIIKSTIDWSNMPKVRFVGQGIGQTIVFVEIDSVTDGFISTNSPSYPKSITIENMSIIGGQTVTDSIAVRDLINISGATFMTMKNVYLYRADRYCMHFGADLINSWFETVTCNLGLKAGLKIDATTPTSTTFTRCYFREAKEGSGVDIDYGLNITFDQCIFEGNGETYPDSSSGIRFRKGSATLIAPYFESNKGIDIKFGETLSVRNSMDVIGATHIGLGTLDGPVAKFPTVWVDVSYTFTYTGGCIVSLRDTIFKFSQNSTGVRVELPSILEGNIYKQNTSTFVITGADDVDGYFHLRNANGVRTYIGGDNIDFRGYNADISNAITSPTIDSLKATLAGLGASTGVSFFNANEWGAGRNYTSRLENVLYSATSRTTVSDTGFQTITQGDLFDNDYGSWAVVDSSDTGIVYIDFTAKSEFGTNGVVYADGYVLLNVYYTDLPDTVIGQVLYKDSTNWTSMTGLEDISTNALYSIYKLTVGTKNNAEQFRFYIIAKSTSDASISEIEYYPLRLTQPRFSPIVDKYNTNSLYEKLSFRNSNNTEKAYIDSNGVASFISISTSHISPITLLNPSTDDTLFLGKWNKIRYYDSLAVFDIQDSIAVQFFYDDGAVTNLITVVDTLASDETIVFDVTAIPIDAKVYMYFVYLGDTEAYIRSQLYWRD